MKLFKSWILGLVGVALLPVLILACVVAALLRRKGRPRLLWGPVPIISNKYWSRAMAAAGYQSRTMMFNFYSTINNRDDYDLYCGSWWERSPRPLRKLADVFLAPYVGFVRGIFGYEIHHMSFAGGFLGFTVLRKIEAQLLKLAGVRTVIMPYGSDFFMYSRIMDPNVKHVLNINYPVHARIEPTLESKAFYWSRHADAVIGYFLWADGLPRNDAGVYSPIIIDTQLWEPRPHFHGHDGRSGVVRVVHTPNHRGFKGTEFLICAVEELQAEGLQVELLLLEKLKNEEVRRIMRDEADILAEQFVISCYALSAMEGMACALPVLANLSGEPQTRVFRRYSYLNECPILSTRLEEIKDNLRLLVTSPQLRRQLGTAGRTYVEKYHSPQAAQFLFSKVYARIWEGKEVDLMNVFHPLLGLGAERGPLVQHPLQENRLPLTKGRALLA